MVFLDVRELVLHEQNNTRTGVCRDWPPRSPLVSQTWFGVFYMYPRWEYPPLGMIILAMGVSVGGWKGEWDA